MLGKYVIAQFNINYLATNLNLSGIDEAKSLISTEKSGNSINWILGHIIATRLKIFTQLGVNVETSDFKEETYRQGIEDTEKIEYNSLDYLKNLNKTIQDRLLDIFNNLTDKQYGRIGDNNKDLAEELLYKSFHESYHIGQLGILRHSIGLKGAIK